MEEVLGLLWLFNHKKKILTTPAFSCYSYQKDVRAKPGNLVVKWYLSSPYKLSTLLIYDFPFVYFASIS